MLCSFQKRIYAEIKFLPESCTVSLSKSTTLWGNYLLLELNESGNKMLWLYHSNETLPKRTFVRYDLFRGVLGDF